MILKFIRGGYEKVKDALSKTRSSLSNSLKALIGKKIDDEILEQLEELFFEADLGVQTSIKLVEKVRELHANNPSITSPEIIEEIQKEILSTIKSQDPSISEAAPNEPTVLLVIGANGNGKTTSVAKLAKLYKDANKKVLIAAADTFRAAATEQLEMWAKKIGVDLVKGQNKGDPSAVVFDALSAAKARQADVILIDTAGRLHTKKDLMQELEKMKRVCSKVQPGAPHEVLLALDATTGQNAIEQAKTFHRFTPMTGLILTKLDGTAKGGITIAIQQELSVPVKFIGTGEAVQDIEAFDAESFVSSLFE